MWCYRSQALHAIISLTSFVFPLLFSPINALLGHSICVFTGITRNKFIDFICIFTAFFSYKRITGSFNLRFHFMISLLSLQRAIVIQSALFMNTEFFSIPYQPYSPNRAASCTSRQHSELLRFTELGEEFRIFKTDNPYDTYTLLWKQVIQYKVYMAKLLLNVTCTS